MNISRGLNQAAIGAALTGPKRRIGRQRIVGGMARMQVASFETGSEEARTLTIYTSATVHAKGSGADPVDRDGFQTVASAAYRVRLFLEFGAGAATRTVEIPVGKPFTVAAAGVRLFAELSAQLPFASHSIAAGLAAADVDVYIADAPAAALSLPSVWIGMGSSMALDSHGVVTDVETPCVLLSAVGHNAGAALAYLQMVGANETRPVFEVPVPAGEPFAIDLTNSGGCPFPQGLTWEASTTAGTVTRDPGALFSVTTEVLFV